MILLIVLVLILLVFLYQTIDELLTIQAIRRVKQDQLRDTLIQWENFSHKNESEHYIGEN